MNRFRAVICGGGIAAAEAALRLQHVAGDEVDITIVAPNEDLVIRPLATAEPFSLPPARTLGLAGIAAASSAKLVKDSLAWVDRAERSVHTGRGEEIGFDALLLAVGARQAAPFKHVATFSDANADDTFRGVVQDVEEGWSRSVAFIVPPGPTYLLPAYELALMTAERASSMAVDATLSIVTPEERPLAVFGPEASGAVASALAERGVETHLRAAPVVPARGRLLVGPGGPELRPDRMIAAPRLHGTSIRGIAGSGRAGFLPIDASCAVRTCDGRVFAAGDAASYPVKHGGIGAQMAHTAAAAIARLAGVEVEPQPFTPTLRARVLGARRPLYLSANLAGSRPLDSAVYASPPWRAEDKVVAEEIGRYMDDLDEHAAQAAARRAKVAGMG